MTTDDIIKEYSDDLNKYITVGAKKAFITRAVKTQQRWLDEIKRAVNEHEGWLFGKKYTKLDIYTDQLILDGIKKLYNTIK